MINVYDTNVNGDKVKVFFYIKEGQICTHTIGNRAVSRDGGVQFYVDDYVALQMDKMVLTMDGNTPKLDLKDGETLEIPEKTEKEKEIEELERRLEELKNAE